MKPWRKFLLVIAGASTVIAVRAQITWTSPTAVVAATDVLTTGSFFAAASAHASSNLVNGVTFAPSTSATSISYGGTQGSFSSQNMGSVSYTAILNSGFYSPGNGSAATLTLSGLTSGAQYRVQVWTPAWDNSYPTTLSAGNTIAMGNTSTVPTWVLGYFTASGSTQIIQYYGTPVGQNPGTHGLIGPVAVYDVSAIPEPGTWAVMLGAGALIGALGWKRRARRRR